MKICAIICEFNPFHNGHRYLLEKARALSGCDAVLCIMSGSFTQRGEMCILDKYTRAKHAVLGGADCVIQLPAPFAVAPAEIFAQGAVKILSSIPDVDYIVCGCETPTDFTVAAKLLLDESQKFKAVLENGLSGGESYIKSYSAAFAACGGDGALLSKPNNILALEYAKAILRANADIELLTVKRIGADYNDGGLKDNYSSSSAIRNNLTNGKLKDNLPDFVFNDMADAHRDGGYESFIRHCLFKSDAENLRRVFGCGEGLENKLKSLENLPYDEIIGHATSKRYSSSRIRRILLSNALEIYGDDTKKFLENGLYIKPLAVKKQRADEILSALANSVYPVITGVQSSALNGTALKCFEKDRYEFAVYNFLTRSDKKDYMIII